MNSFEIFQSAAVPAIKKQINDTLFAWTDTLSRESPSLKHLNDLFLQNFAGGKYIRGTLVMLGYSLTSKKTNTDVLKVAAAFEILHTGLLIHDDVMDKSLTRRGKPTLHTALGVNHTGMSQAICFGDVAFFLAMKLLRENTTLLPFANMALETILGQLLDLQPSKKIPTEEDVLAIYRLKTARYSIVAPLQIGATLGNASQQILNAISRFGEALGIAFQIQDDILGVFSDEKTLGKSVTSDIEEGKQTLLLIYASQNATASQKAFLKQHYGTGPLDKKVHEQIKTIFITTGAYDYSQKKAAEYIQKSKREIAKITTNKILTNRLISCVELLAKRKK